MTCALCSQAPKLKGRKCAFGSLLFDPDNWMCETMGKLRDSALWSHRDDLDNGSIAVVPLKPTEDEGGYIVLTYYKNRGTTEGAFFVHESNQMVLTKTLAERTVKGAAA